MRLIALRRGVRGLLRNKSTFLLLVPVLIYLPAVVYWQLPNQFAMVMSGSMEPAYRRGDLVFLRAVDEVRVGDVVAFETMRGMGYPRRMLHRVVEYDREGARLTTKGDANPDTDPVKVGLESVPWSAAIFSGTVPASRKRSSASRYCDGTLVGMALSLMISILCRMFNVDAASPASAQSVFPS